MKLIIPLNPVPWSAHKGYGRRSFNPRFKEKEAYQFFIRKEAKGEFLKGAISLMVTYHFKPPSSLSQKKKNQMISHEIYHTKRPDLDNLNKFLCDCLKGVIFEDDSQIVQIHANKTYDKDEFTFIESFSMQDSSQ